MSFIVRQISRTADGREIVRPRSFAQAELSIGRGTESDIHLPDLAVTLHHAVIRHISDSSIEISSVAGLPFEVDGRSVASARINVQKGADIRIGSHALSVSASEAGEAPAVVITVERVGAVSDASEAKNESHVFSLAAVLPSKRVFAWVLAAAVLAIFLAWPLFSIHTSEPAKTRAVAFHADEMWSSGDLSQVHTKLQNNCQACHTDPGVAVRDDSCVACHDAVHDHADPKRLAAARPELSLPGKAERAVAATFNIPPGRCVECHTEHEGAKAMPTTAQRFCSDCHADLASRLPDAKVANASDFGTDHPEFRPTIRPSLNGPFARVSLAGAPKEDNGLKFPHKLHLSASGGVARMAQTLGGQEGYGNALKCADCHRTDSSGTSFIPVDMERNCSSCHSLAFEQVGGTVRTLRHGDPAQVIADIRAYYRATGPQRPVALQGMTRRRPGDFATQEAAISFARASAARPTGAESAVRMVFSEGGACADCHVVTQPGAKGAPFGIAPVKLPRRYLAKGWFDHASHDSEKCESCHLASKSDKAGDVLLPGIATCQTCHGGETAHKKVPSSCAMCHDYHMDSSAPLMIRKDRVRGKRLDYIDRKKMTEAGGGA